MERRNPPSLLGMETGAATGPPMVAVHEHGRFRPVGLAERVLLQGAVDQAVIGAAAGVFQRLHTADRVGDDLFAVLFQSKRSVPGLDKDLSFFQTDRHPQIDERVCHNDL